MSTKCCCLDLEPQDETVEACGYDLDTGHIRWGLGNTRQVAAGSAYTFTPMYQGFADVLERISTNGSRTVIEESTTIMNWIGTCSQSADGTIGVVGYKKPTSNFNETQLVYSTDLSGSNPTFTTEPQGTNPFFRRVSQPLIYDVNVFFSDTMYVMRVDPSNSFDVIIERISDGTTMSAFLSSAGSMFTVPAGNSAKFMVFDGANDDVFTGTFGASSWTYEGRLLDSRGYAGNSQAKLTDNHFIWYYTSSGVLEYQPLALTGGTVVASGSPYFQTLGDKVLVAESNGTISVYTDTGTLSWSQSNANTTLKRAMPVGVNGDIIAHLVSTTTGQHLLRRYSITDGSIVWKVKADQIINANMMANYSLGQIVTTVSDTRSESVLLSDCGTEDDS